ncbi:hypothetical protein LYZ84_21905, partial [Xanthomonas hortorum pv. pelargonii]|nr:hypothetical protein [Xanthomonas hortorum pv. pelargonii]
QEDLPAGLLALAQAFSVAERQLHGLLLNMRRVVSRIYGALFRASLTRCRRKNFSRKVDWLKRVGAAPGADAATAPSWRTQKDHRSQCNARRLMLSLLGKVWIILSVNSFVVPSITSVPGCCTWTLSGRRY